MSDRSRRRSSKWDLKEDRPVSPENIRERSREMDKLGSWDGDGGYSTRMSPGLNDWTRQTHGHSPREKWDRPARNRSRSRSRSPLRGFRQESGSYDRNRSRSTAPCRDFNAGRCRRGSDCPFVHEGNRNYDDSWEDRSRKGGMPNYTAPRDATEYQSRSSNDRDRDRNRNYNIICKYFAAGNCRSGSYCRFSHGKSESPERKMDGANKYSEDLRWRGNGPVSDTRKYEDGNGRRGALEQRVDDRFSDGRRDSRFEKDNRSWNDSTTVASSVIPHSPRSTEKVLADAEMSPDWNYRLKPSSHSKDEGRHNTYSSPVPTAVRPIHGQGSTWNGSGQMNHSPSVNMEMRFDSIPQGDMNFSSNVFRGQGFDQNHQHMSAIALPNTNSAVQADLVIPVEPRRDGGALNPQNSGIFVEGKFVETPNTSQITGIPPHNNAVSGEQLTQLNNLSASLVQILEAGKQLPQIYAALSTPQPPIQGPVEPVRPVLSNISIASGEQDTEQKKADTSDGLLRAAEAEQAYGSNTGSSNQAGPSENHDSKDNAEEAVDGSKKIDESKDARNDDRVEKENVGGEPKEDVKKNKEAKSVRAFKFALAEFVKELLKPTWKDGLVVKDAYKTIVKKVVDKVTGSLQGANIPQSQEKIDHYLSVSKPKLTKLVQAYVEKVQKSNK